MERQTARWKRDITSVSVILLLMMFLGLFKAYVEGDFTSVDALRQYISSFGFLGPLVLTVLQAAQVVVPVLPGLLGCIVGAVLFGAWGGFVCNYVGISIGSIAAYFLARRYGVPFVRQMFPGKQYDTLTAWVMKRKHYTAVFALSILLPLAPDDFLCYFSGLTGMSASRFIWIIIAAKPWCILLYSFFFAKVI